MGTTGRARDRGFTLVELLVVVVILGILSAASTFAVRAITDRGETSACATDLRTLEQAEDVQFSMHGAYGTEDDLVAAGVLHGASAMHDIILTDDTYTVIAVGTCAISG